MRILEDEEYPQHVCHPAQVGFSTGRYGAGIAIFLSFFIASGGHERMHVYIYACVPLEVPEKPTKGDSKKGNDFFLSWEPFIFRRCSELREMMPLEGTYERTGGLQKRSSPFLRIPSESRASAVFVETSTDCAIPCKPLLVRGKKHEDVYFIV